MLLTYTLAISALSCTAAEKSAEITKYPAQAPLDFLQMICYNQAKKQGEIPMQEEYIIDKLPPEVRADYLDRIRRFVLMDDTFMAKVFEDKKCVELLLKIILGQYRTKIVHVLRSQIFRQIVQ